MQELLSLRALIIVEVYTRPVTEGQCRNKRHTPARAARKMYKERTGGFSSLEIRVTAMK